MNTWRNIALAAVVVIVAVTVFGCRRKPVEPTPSDPTTSTSTSAQNTTTTTASGTTMTGTTSTAPDSVPGTETTKTTYRTNVPTTARRGSVNQAASTGAAAWPPTAASSTQPTTPDTSDKWTLFWSDEFDGTALNPDHWEAESYIQNGTYLTGRPENVRVENGNLILTARRENYNGVSYTSASVKSSNKFSFLYGRLEFRARLPYGQGVWPALWTMGNDYLQMGDEDGWPYAGEIDVMEMIGAGSEVDKYSLLGNNLTTCNLHWGKDRENHQSSEGRYRLPTGILADAYHIYAIEWDETSIRWYFDDVKIHEMDTTDPTMMGAFQKPHWIIMNIALNTEFEPLVNSSTPLPQSMYIDYVRVYKPVG